MERKAFIREAFPKKDLFPKKKIEVATKTATKGVAKKITKVSKAKVEEGPKVRVELWVYDEYNQGSIVASSTNLSDIIKKARGYVTSLNVDNALAGGERDKTWEAHFPEMIKSGEVDPNILYAGNKKNGNHYAYVFESKKWKLVPLPKDATMRFFLGEISDGRKKRDWYLANHKGTVITSLTDQSLDRKTVLFIKIV